MKLLLFPMLLTLSVTACAPTSQEQAAAPAMSEAPSPVPSHAAPAASTPARALSTPAATAKEADVDVRIDKILGDHKAYRSALERLQQAVSGDDRSGVAALVRYPLEFRSRNGKLRIDNAQAFVAHYEDIVTPSVAQAISGQRYADLFVSQNGVMLGSGEVWINGACHDPKCVDVDVKVITFQQGG